MVIRPVNFTSPADFDEVERTNRGVEAF